MSLVPIAAAAAALLFNAVHAAPTANPIHFVPGQFHYQPQHNHPLAHFDEQHDRKPIKNSYMVVLKDGTTTTDFFQHRTQVVAAQSQANAFHDVDFALNHVYDADQHFQGYAGTFTDDVVAWIRAQPEVAFVEQDTVVSTTEMPYDSHMVWDVPYDTQQFHADAATVQKSAPWGLARISHRKELGFGTFNKYEYQADGGDGVTAYIIDTGINIKHVEFEGRARWGKTMPQGDTDDDGNGHGTHCAGTIGSRKYGVAKKAELVAVKVLGSGGSGSMSDVTGGVLWAYGDAKDQSAKMAANPSSAQAKKHKGFVANMSLGGGKSPALDKSVNAAATGGLHFAVAAGNENQDACNTSPAGASNPVTVGASTIQDERAYFSNKGKCVDIFAPGLNILSTWNTGNTSVNTISGTSMASPHIVGLLAYLLSVYGSNDFPTIKGAIPMPTSAPAPTLVVADYASSLASTIAQTLPLPAMALDAVHAVLDFFHPAPQRDAVVRAPSVVSVLHPEDLKKALIQLSTPGILTDLDSDTVNKLAFNNATSSS